MQMVTREIQVHSPVPSKKGTDVSSGRQTLGCVLIISTLSYILVLVPKLD